MPTQETRLLELDGYQIPLQIHWELRRNVRASVGKRAFILRLPCLLLKGEQVRQLAWFEDWVRQQLANHLALRARFMRRAYTTSDTLRVGERLYSIAIVHSTRRTDGGSIRDGVIQLSMSDAHDPLLAQERIRKLLSRLVAQDFKPEIEARVHALNAQHFQQTIGTIRLKYNQSNWGSCSSKGNVNLSTRLLFAPAVVRDYVIVHELAHLMELNHSARFWALVARAMPNYKKQELWLKTHGHVCDF